MRLDDIFTLMIDWGMMMDKRFHHVFKLYMAKMLKRRRVMIIYDADKPIAILTFFVTDDYRSLARKNEWSCPKDQERGRQILIDKLLCKDYSFSMRRHLQELFENAFPWADEAHYLRAPYDRHVRIKRRSQRRQLCLRNTP